MPEVEAVRAALGGRDNVDVVVYDEAGHGFSMPGMPGFNGAGRRSLVAIGVGLSRRIAALIRPA